MPFAPYDDDEEEFLLASCRAASSFFKRSAISESVLDDDEDDEDVEVVLELLPVEELSLVCAAPPGPPENVLANTVFSSLAWSEVSLPLDTSLSIRLSILDCMSCGDGGVLELELDAELLAPLFNAESMSSSAEDKAL